MIYTASAENYLRQLAHAHKIAADYEAFARSIGCTVHGDEITCHTAEQSEMMDAKWKELTR